jgi:hypothetical protein
MPASLIAFSADVDLQSLEGRATKLQLMSLELLIKSVHSD